MNIDQQWKAQWKERKAGFVDTCIEVLGLKQTQRKEWLANTTWTRIKQRKDIKQKIKRKANIEKKVEQYYTLATTLDSEAEREVKHVAKKTRNTSSNSYSRDSLAA